MTVVSLEEAQAHLAELLDRLMPGDELFITRDGRCVAKLCGLPHAVAQPVFGSAKGKLTILDDSDDHLADFEGAVG